MSRQRIFVVGGRKRGGTWARQGGLAVLLLVALSGCKSEPPLNQGIALQPLREPTNVIGSATPAIKVDGAAPDLTGGGGGGGAGVSLFPANAAGRAVPQSLRDSAAYRFNSQAEQHKDYIAKSDVYFKLNWMRRELLSGKVPSNMAEEADAALTKLQHTWHDPNQRLAEEALQRILKGWEHFQADLTLRAALVDSNLVPWSDGKQSLDRFIAQGGLGFGEKNALSEETPRRRSSDHRSLDEAAPMTPAEDSEGSSLTPTQQTALETVRHYAEQYQASPRELMRREWEKAIQLTNRLRDELGLKNIEGVNDDGDSETLRDDLGEDTLPGSLPDHTYSVPSSLPPALP